MLHENVNDIEFHYG